MEVTLDTWIVSDTHFGHKNIVKYCDRPANHNNIMASNWKAVIGENDTVLHLGDLAIWYGDEKLQWEEFACNLPGKKMMVRGNHDEEKAARYRAMGFPIIAPFMAEFNNHCFLFTHDLTYHVTRSKWDYNIHGHVHNHRPHRWSKYHINVSMEVMNYKPIQLKDLISGLK